MKIKHTVEFETSGTREPMSASEMGTFVIALQNMGIPDDVHPVPIQRDIGPQMEAMWITVGMKVTWEEDV